MLLKINKKERIAEIWLSNTEKESPSARKKAEALCADYSDQKYKAVIFLSGGGDMYDSLKGLAITNRQKLIKNDKENKNEEQR